MRNGGHVKTDPIMYAGGPNLYAYVGNDPVNWTDPNGLQIVRSRRCSVTVGNEEEQWATCTWSTNPTYSAVQSVNDFISAWQDPNYLGFLIGRTLGSDPRLELAMPRGYQGGRQDAEALSDQSIFGPYTFCPVMEAEASIGLQAGLEGRAGVNFQSLFDAGSVRARFRWSEAGVQTGVFETQGLAGEISAGPVGRGGWAGWEAPMGNNPRHPAIWDAPFSVNKATSFIGIGGGVNALFGLTGRVGAEIIQGSSEDCRR